MRNLTRYGIDLKVAQAYTESLEKHLFYLREAGGKLGVSPAQLRAHDSSKWSLHEFPAYAEWFYGSKSDPVGFERAVLHHYHCNPHHWQHWSFTDGFRGWSGQLDNGLMEMPENYVLEMVADWQGSSMAYTGSYDISGWLATNLPTIKLHSKTRVVLLETLAELGYKVDL
jgi:hypothetical protein